MKRQTDSLRLLRQKTIDSNKKVLQQKSDSLNAIKKHRESKQYNDSVKEARTTVINNLRETRTQYFDSVKAERKRLLDSSIEQRAHISDSIKNKLKIKSDSLNSIRKIKESKKYKDSIARARNAQIDSMRNVRIKYFDSVKAERKQMLDSSLAARKKISDALHQKQKARADSLTIIRKYKESKRYSDSVKVVRQEHLDSLRAVRKIASDKIIAARKQSLDSAKAARKVIMDALTATRKKTVDSLKAVHQIRTDSLAKVKERKLKEQKAQLKKREDKMKLSFELKIAKKHKAYTNETMLKKKWTLVRQGFQNTYTHYNYFFNARRKMNEAMLNMQRRKKDNYDELITLFPFDPNIDSTVFSSDMDSIIRKASVGIQIHDPRTKWADDLYLLMGRAYYYKGNFTNADITFRYIIGMKNRFPKKKKEKNNSVAQKKTGDGNALVQTEKQSRLTKIFKHRPAHNDAVLWLTRTFADSHHEAQAESILDLLDASTKLPESMKVKIALEKANLYTRRASYKQASAQLDIVVQSKVTAKYIRQRAAYLNGQILNDLGNYAAAAENFKKTYELHPNIEMDFYARKNRANSLMLNGGEQGESIAALKRILKDGKYSPYYEQVYFILGKLSANNNDITDALTYFAKSLTLPKTSKKQKAITFATIGNIQYAVGNYNAANKAYDSASYFAKHAPDNKDVQIALLRAKSLDKVEEPYNSIQIQDSLLKLAAMSDKDQRSVVRKYIKYLEQLKEDSLVNAQNPTLAGGTPGNPGDPTNSTSWYFSSPVAIQQGFNDFKRKWGTRPLSDNWRRASSSSFGSTDTANNTAESDDHIDEQDGNGLPSEKSLLSGIPKTEKQLEETRKKLRRAYVNLAEAYIKNLEDYKSGVRTLDTLDSRFPNHEYADQVLSLRYLAALRQNKLEDAQKYSNRLAEQYPNSSFTKVVRPDENDTTANSDSAAKITVAEYYEATYDLAHERKYDEVLQRVALAKKQYGDASYARKFRVLEALSLAGTGQYKKADTAITKYIAEYPSDSLRPWIDAIAKNVKEQKAADTVKVELPKIDSNALNKLPKIDSTLLAKVAPDNYVYKASEIHYCLFVFGKADVKIAGFKSGLVDFASFKFSTLGLTSSMQSMTGDNTIILTKQFANAAQAKVFMNAVKNEPKLFRDFPSGSYQLFIISESNYTKLMKDKKIADYVTFFNKNYR